MRARSRSFIFLATVRMLAHASLSESILESRTNAGMRPGAPAFSSAHRGVVIRCVRKRITFFQPAEPHSPIPMIWPHPIHVGDRVPATAVGHPDFDSVTRMRRWASTPRL